MNEDKKITKTLEMVPNYKMFPDISFSGVSVSSPIRKTFRVSRVQFDGSKKLVETGEEDLQQLVNSGYSSSLDFILDRFLDGSAVSDLNVSGSLDFDQKFLEDKLDIASAYVENMEEVAEAYGLPEDMSYDDIRDFLNTKYTEHMSALQNKQNLNGGISNETQTIEPQESAQTVETVAP